MKGASLLFFTSVLSCSAKKEQYEIKAEPGDTVTLPCGVHSNISIIVVEWSRTDLETEYVFLQRGSRSESFKQHESFKNRVELKDREKKDGDVSLILRNVTFNDTGTYECRVVQRRTNHRKRSILKSDPIITLKLTGVGENTTEKPGNEGDKEEDGGNTTVISVVVPVVLLLLLVVGILGFWFYKKQRGSTD
ncbi:uncharacterized protein LOC113168386 isoform X2 [Anabas testudineus]|uniref:uncharacterized protein LOC113168386 isoform X2 n=1 Tax=Anabas testudineus TaxID=64144 RepID=UPI000E465FD4|nr:uncharacterized protein LOC113168386 isoform X2 [Anabas testudineus]